MKLANIELPSGARAVIARSSDGVIRDISSLVAGKIPGIRSVLENAVLETIQADDTVLSSCPKLDPGAIAAFLPVAEADSKVFCVGLNYGSHADELGVGIPKHPSIFARYGTTCVGHEGKITLPRTSEKVDWEGELALIIGREIKYVGEDNAMAAIVGATCFNDVSMRDFQERLPKITLAKNFDGSGPMGPWLVTSDEVSDYDNLKLRTRVNGKVMQDASTSDFIFTIPFIVDLVSQVCRLRPGDVIATGTPAGVGWGQKPPVYLQAGDVVEVEIENVGLLRNSCETEPR